MKKILFFLIALVITFISYSQSTLYLRGDTVRMQRMGGNSTLIIENATRGVTGGVLTNMGGGRTEFVLGAGGGGDSAFNLYVRDLGATGIPAGRKYADSLGLRKIYAGTNITVDTVAPDGGIRISAAGSAYTGDNGILLTGTNFTNTLFTGINASTQTVTGSTQSSGNLILRGTAHATPGNIFFGSALVSRYVEAEGFLGLNVNPTSRLHIVEEGGTSNAPIRVDVNSSARDLNALIFNYSEGGSFKVYDAATSGAIPGIRFLSSVTEGMGGVVMGEMDAARDSLNLNGAAVMAIGQRDDDDMLEYSNLWNVRNVDSVRTSVHASGRTAIGPHSATAWLHIRPGTTTNGPFKLTQGPLVTTITGGVQDGLVEYDGTHYYGIIGSTRYQLDQQTGGGLYTSSNGITLASDNFKLGGTLVNNTDVNGASLYNLSFSNLASFSAEATTINNTTLNVLPAYIRAQVSSITTDTTTTIRVDRDGYVYLESDATSNSNMYIWPDSIAFNAQGGKYRFSGLQSTIDTTTYKYLVVDADGKIRKSNSVAQFGDGGGAGGGVTNVATGLGLSGGPITTTGTIIADTTYLVNKSTQQVVAGQKNFTGGIEALNVYSPTIYGGRASGESLTLDPTSHATKGNIILSTTAKAYLDVVNAEFHVGGATDYGAYGMQVAGQFIAGRGGTNSVSVLTFSNNSTGSTALQFNTSTDAVLGSLRAYGPTNSTTLGGVAFTNAMYLQSQSGPLVLNANSGTIHLFTNNTAPTLTALTSGNVGIGISPATRFHVLSTTEQNRIGYDASNYFSTTVGSTGSTTLNLVGTSPFLTLSDPFRVTERITANTYSHAGLTVDNDIDTLVGTNNGDFYLYVMPTTTPVGIVNEINTITYTIASASGAYIYNNSTADGAWTLPALNDYRYEIKNISDEDLVITRAGADNLYDTGSVTSITLTPGQSRTIWGGPSFWYVL